MRHSLTLPLALAAFAAAPALSAQDATPPVEAATATPQTKPPADDSVTPPEGDPVPAEATTTSALTAEQKAAYDAWPANARTYFDGLTPTRQAIFLRIADADKLRIVALNADQQAQVWTSLEAQAAQQKATTPPAN